MLPPPRHPVLLSPHQSYPIPHLSSLESKTGTRRAGCPGGSERWFLALDKQELEERAPSQGTCEGLGIPPALTGLWAQRLPGFLTSSHSPLHPVTQCHL